MPRPCSPPTVEHLGAARLLRDGRVAVEKPFGHDLSSARELNARLHRLLRESQILRVDHFLGKEPPLTAMEAMLAAHITRPANRTGRRA
ncbi:MAG TPA: hypothetical protein VF070_18325 [Streptosporangiaceae bacterium]